VALWPDNTNPSANAMRRLYRQWMESLAVLKGDPSKGVLAILEGLSRNVTRMVMCLKPQALDSESFRQPHSQKVFL
jgi:hypothetical protein